MERLRLQARGKSELELGMAMTSKGVYLELNRRLSNTRFFEYPKSELYTAYVLVSHSVLASYWTRAAKIRTEQANGVLAFYLSQGSNLSF